MKRIAVLAGNYRQFMDHMLKEIDRRRLPALLISTTKSVVSITNVGQYYFIRGVDDIRGREFNEMVIVGTFYNPELETETKARIRYCV